MNKQFVLTIGLVLALLLPLGAAPVAAQPETPGSAQGSVGSAFTYQGSLVKNGSPFSGTCDFTFTLWNAASSGASPLGSEPKTGVGVANGVFTVLLNETGQFGANAFDGNQRWLGTSVKCASDSTATDLGRQALSAAPYASFAVTAGSVTNGVLTTGSYADPAWITSLSASKISGVLPVAKGGTGSATQNFVDLSSAQTVAGSKTFSSPPAFNTGFLLQHQVPFTVGSLSNLVVNNLNADMVDGAHAGNGVNKLALNNGWLNTNLNADLLDGQHASAFQARVNGTCAVGSTIRAINVDGSVACQADAPLNRAAVPQVNMITTPDSGGAVGRYSSITIGADGLPVISYRDDTNGDLKLMHCGNVFCTTGDLHTPDSSGDVGLHTSIILGADGLPVISYYDQTNHVLKVLHCGNTVCNTGNAITTINSSGDVGGYSSIAIGADGFPVISYYDATNGDLIMLHCGSTSCSGGGDSHIPDSSGDVGQYTSITIGVDGLPVISYYDNGNGGLKVLHCGNTVCNTGNNITTADSSLDVGRFTSITIGADGLPVISYHDDSHEALKLLHCGNIACSGGNTATTVDSSGNTGYFTSITIGPDGLPLISYRDIGNSALKVMHCGNVSCSSGNTSTTVDSSADVGEYTSITLGVDGLPVISYHDVTNGDLKVLHCSNAFCAPYFRRR